MVLGFTSNSGANLKLEFISGFAVGVQLQKSPVFSCWVFLLQVYTMLFQDYMRRNLYSHQQFASKKQDLRKYNRLENLMLE